MYTGSPQTVHFAFGETDGSASPVKIHLLERSLSCIITSMISQYNKSHKFRKAFSLATYCVFRLLSLIADTRVFCLSKEFDIANQDVESYCNTLSLMPCFVSGADIPVIDCLNFFIYYYLTNLTIAKYCFTFCSIRRYFESYAKKAVSI